MMNTIKITLPNGVVLSGDDDQVLIESAKKLGYDMNKDGKYYYSQSDHKFVRIEDMDPMYCRNAFLKTLGAKVDKCLDEARLENASAFVERFKNFGNTMIADDKMLVAMLVRIRDRGKF